MKKTIVFCLVALLALVACTDYKVDHGDPDKCMAGQVLIGGKCVPAGCSQDIHCDDGNPCNGVEKCIEGRCSRGGVIVESCDDGVECTNDRCDPNLAECSHQVDDTLCEEWELCDAHEGCIGRPCTKADDCSDGLYCNGPEDCLDGKCLVGDPVDCDDSISCTVDTCSEEAGVCQHVPDHEACPAGEICDPHLGCKIKPCGSNSDCDDGSHCNGMEECISGRCVGGLPVDCTDQVDCTVDRCDESAKGCINTPDHSLCDDGQYCNGVELCEANTGCVAGVMVDCHDDVGCTKDTCNEDLDVCQYDPRNELCAATEICDPLKDCIQIGCTTDSDCPGGMVCQNGKCIGMVEEPAPMDGGDDGGMPADDGGDDGYGDDGCCMGDDGGDPGEDGADDGDGCCPGDDGGDDGCCQGDDGGSPGDDGGDGGDEICDEGDSQNCDTGQLGECALGIQYCFNNTWTTCQQLHTPMPEMCDARDNDCDGQTDEEEVCACLTGCLDTSACESGGVEELCEHVPGFFNACILHCENEFECPATEDGTSRVCVDALAFALGPICVCETSQCPQECVVDSDCYPYGLTSCMGNSCTSPCSTSLECPLPYLCGEASMMCECDSGNIGASCLSCGSDLDCTPPAPCTYRNYETDPSTIYKECEYPCMLTEECPATTGGDPLYCRWGEGNTASRCACEPETACQPCGQVTPDPCKPYSMICSTITDPMGGAETITGCTAPCQNDGHCPDGWYCLDDGLSNHGWCVEASCNCVDVECGPGGIPEADCMMMHPGFECIQDNSTDPPIDLCTKYCAESKDCPLGYHCDDGSSTAGMPVCRCSMPASTTGD